VPDWRLRSEKKTTRARTGALTYSYTSAPADSRQPRYGRVSCKLGSGIVCSVRRIPKHPACISYGDAIGSRGADQAAPHPALSPRSRRVRISSGVPSVKASEHTLVPAAKPLVDNHDLIRFSPSKNQIDRLMFVSPTLSCTCTLLRFFTLRSAARKRAPPTSNHIADSMFMPHTSGIAQSLRQFSLSAPSLEILTPSIRIRASQRTLASPRNPPDRGFVNPEHNTERYDRENLSPKTTSCGHCGRARSRA